MRTEQTSVRNVTDRPERSTMSQRRPPVQQPARGRQRRRICERILAAIVHGLDGADTQRQAAMAAISRTRVLQQNRHARRPWPRYAGVPRGDASRQSPRDADRMPDLAGAAMIAKDFPGTIKTARGRRISAHRALLAGRLCRLRFRRHREIQGRRTAKNSRRRRRQLRELPLRHQGAARQSAGQNRLGQGRRPHADDGAQPRRPEESDDGRCQARRGRIQQDGRAVREGGDSAGAAQRGLRALDRSTASGPTTCCSICSIRSW